MKFHFSRAIVLLIPICLVGVTARAATLDAFLKNREALKKYEQKAYFPSYQEFLKALQSDPMNPEIQLNLGRALEANQEFDKAQKAYRGALQLLPKDSNLRFEALFNLGNVQTKLKRIDEALATYQLALEMVPDSIEVKTNIELLWQNSQGGEGENQDKQQQQQQQNQKQGGKGDKPQEQPEQQQQKKPKPFDSQNLSQEDVKRILDEIKNQEQSIRANDYEKGAKDAPKAKDW